MRAGLGRAGSAAFINTHTHTPTPDCPFLRPTRISAPCPPLTSLLSFSSLRRWDISWISERRFPIRSFKQIRQPLTRLPSSSHVQLQLLPGQVWPQGEGASAPIQREELRLLHEDHLLIFLSDPVPHHRLSGALPHLRTTRTISGGEESQGQCGHPPPLLSV